MGLQREGLSLSEEECRLLACHEAGHAAVAATLRGGDPLHKVSIVPRGQSLGATHQLPERERYVVTRAELEQRLAVLLGGRAAEVLLLETMTSGAEDDLERATKLARRMVLRWGMGQRSECVAHGGERQDVFLGEEISHRREYSEATARQIDEDIQALLERAFEQARGVLEQHREGVERLVQELLEQEEVPGERALELLGPAPGADADRPEEDPVEEVA
jgi:cell division protease FtsH